EPDSITVSGCAIGPADRLLDAACPARVEDLAVPVDNRHAGLIGHKVGTTFPPGKVNTDRSPIIAYRTGRLVAMVPPGDVGDRPGGESGRLSHAGMTSGMSHDRAPTRRLSCRPLPPQRVALLITARLTAAIP